MRSKALAAERVSNGIVKYAVIADIHANLPALQAVLKDIATQQCGAVVCLGDMVGYYSEPKACVDIIRHMNMICVRGNHDEYCATPGGVDGELLENVRWTWGQLTANDRRWLAGLPLVETVADFTIVHASLDAPHRWEYVFDMLAAARSLRHQKTSICFFGHTHVPVAFLRDRVLTGGSFSRITVSSGKQYFINPGSVGQPRDGCPNASYIIYDTDERTVALRRIDYERPNSGGNPAIPTKAGPKPKLPGSAQAQVLEVSE